MNVNKVCPKCGYERKPEDLGTDIECPKCGVVYAKWERALNKTRESENQEPSPVLSGPASASISEMGVDENDSPEARMAKLTAILETQTHLKKERTRSMTLALAVIPSMFFGFGLFIACWKLFGPLIVVTRAIGSRGTDAWTIVFSPNPTPWGIIAVGFILPFFVRWFREVRRSLKS